MKEKYFGFQSLSYLSVKARESTRPISERFHFREKSYELKVMPTFPTGNSALGPVNSLLDIRRNGSSLALFSCPEIIEEIELLV